MSGPVFPLPVEWLTPHDSGLRETEGAHRQALVELEEMRSSMARMEEERAAMVAEVEAQIERALQSMVFSESETDDHDPNLTSSPRPSRPSSRRSSVTSASGGGRGLRSFGTGSTLTEDVEAEEAAVAESKEESEKEKVVAVEPIKLKRFSATQRDMQADVMITVDENITERSDKISKKVMEIQQKVSLSSDEDLFFY